MDFLHLCAIYLQILTTLLIVFSRNPIHSILLLIVLFFEMTFVLILFNVEFISLLLIVVYVGAIAVLFLFVVMMLQVKSEPFNSSYIILISFILSLFFYFENVFLFNKHNIFFCALHSSSTEFSFYLDSLKDIETLGQVLFNYYPVYIVIAGLLLLAALIGSIVLIIDVNKSIQSNVVFRRLSRTDNFVCFFL
jgi:NADH-quinone oxidoreductase subunit J